MHNSISGQVIFWLFAQPPFYSTNRGFNMKTTLDTTWMVSKCKILLLPDKFVSISENHCTELRRRVRLRELTIRRPGRKFPQPRTSLSQRLCIGNCDFIYQILGRCKTSRRLTGHMALKWEIFDKWSSVRVGAVYSMKVLWPPHVTCVVCTSMIWLELKNVIIGDW